MFKKAIITAGTVVLSMMVLLAANHVEIDNKDADHIMDRADSLEGEVIDANTEEAIPNATVQLINGDDRSNTETTTTDNSGEFSFDGLDNDSYTLEVEARGYETKEKDVDLDKDRDRDEYGEKDKDKMKIELQPEY